MTGGGGGGGLQNGELCGKFGTSGVGALGELLKTVTDLNYWNNLNEQCGPQTRVLEHLVRG